MTRSLIQKIKRAIERRVEAEIAWEACRLDPRGQLPAHKPYFDAVDKRRDELNRLITRLWDATPIEPRTKK